MKKKVMPLSCLMAAAMLAGCGTAAPAVPEETTAPAVETAEAAQETAPADAAESEAAAVEKTAGVWQVEPCYNFDEIVPLYSEWDHTAGKNAADGLYAFSWGGAFCPRWRAPARCAAGFYLSRPDTLFYGRLLPSLSVPHPLRRKQLLLPVLNFFRLVQSFEMPLYRPSVHLFPHRPLSPANHHTHCGSAARAYIPAHSPADPADPVQSFS